jgi:sulfur-oxidizing protein SoxZ
MLLGRIQVPARARRGDVFEVRVLVQHPMENGFRRDMNGAAIPLNILQRVRCSYAGRDVFRAELGSGMAANPYIAFHLRADRSGPIEVEWSDDRGDSGRAAARIEVE